MNSLYLFPPDDNPPMKTCTGLCGRVLPATAEYFHRHKSNKDGFQYSCKQCRSIAKPKEIPPEGYKQCSKCKRNYPATTENFSYRSEYKGRKPRLSSHCKQCKSDDDKAYGESHREERKKYNEDHREERKIYRNKWRQEHLEHEKNYQVNYIREHSERISQNHKAYCDQYYQTDHGRMQMRVSSHNRRARKRNAEGSHTLEELQEQYTRQKGKCYYCKKRLGKSRNSYHADHIVPLARGGTNYIYNIVIACPDCNLSKQDKMPHEWGDGGRLC